MKNIAILSDAENLDFEALANNFVAYYQIFDSEEVINSENFTDFIKIFQLKKFNFLFSFNTIFCYKYSVVDIVTNIINIKFKFDEEFLIKVKTCLHEAITNGLLHGNLDMHGGYNNYKEFTEFMAAVESKVNDKDYFAKRVLIRVIFNEKNFIIKLKDSGNKNIIIPDVTTKYNNGIKIIKSLTKEVKFNENGTIEMIF